MRALVVVMILALFSAVSPSGVAQAQTYEQVCQELIRHFDPYTSYSLSFEKQESGVIYLKRNPNRNTGRYTTYQIGGTPTSHLATACYTKPDQKTLALIEVFIVPQTQNPLWCNYSGIDKWEKGDCGWQEWPLYQAFDSKKISRVEETAQARERAKQSQDTAISNQMDQGRIQMNQWVDCIKSEDTAFKDAVTRYYRPGHDVGTPPYVEDFRASCGNQP